MKSKTRVLIVEDEALIAESLKIDLEHLGVDVLDPVAKGETAVKVALKEKPSLILMDIRLAGGMDGIEAAERIMNHQYIPIVFMTGFATDYIKERAIKLKPVDYIEKPINVNKIAIILDNL
jgi:CheY-like chemotaxis protein